MGGGGVVVKRNFGLQRLVAVECRTLLSFAIREFFSCSRGRHREGSLGALITKCAVHPRGRHPCTCTCIHDCPRPCSQINDMGTQVTGGAPRTDRQQASNCTCTLHLKTQYDRNIQMSISGETACKQIRIPEKAILGAASTTRSNHIHSSMCV